LAAMYLITFTDVFDKDFINIDVFYFYFCCIYNTKISFID